MFTLKGTRVELLPAHARNYPDATVHQIQETPAEPSRDTHYSADVQAAA
jgi:hypothetical protein